MMGKGRRVGLPSVLVCHCSQLGQSLKAGCAGGGGGGGGGGLHSDRVVMVVVGGFCRFKPLSHLTHVPSDLATPDLCPV